MILILNLVEETEDQNEGHKWWHEPTDQEAPDIHDTAFAEVTARLGDQAIRARITRQAVDDLRLEIGKDVFLLMKSVSFDRRVLISSKS